MTQEFVPYELAAKLKAIGFNEPCMFVHDTWGNTKNWTEDGEGEHRNSHINASIYYSAPLFQQVFRWFRNVHKLWGYQIPWSGNMYCMQIWRLIEDSETVKTIQDRVIMNTWEETELACLEKLIEIVETKSE